MKTSWKRCIEFSNMAQAYLARTEGRETKLRYAINRTLARIQKQQETVNEALADIEIDFCLTEKSGESDVIVRDAAGGLRYTREGIKARNKQTRTFLNSESIELDPYLATSLPADLNEFEIEAFAGFVISKEDAERLLQEREALIVSDSTAGQNGEQVFAASL